jgi:predicted secreted Zn-dependent protease
VVRQALVVPAAAVDGYQAVLTVDGYALVNAEGRAIYALNRQPQIQPSESEPVVVTILDAEMAV